MRAWTEIPPDAGCQTLPSGMTLQPGHLVFQPETTKGKSPDDILLGSLCHGRLPRIIERCNSGRHQVLGRFDSRTAKRQMTGNPAKKVLLSPNYFSHPARKVFVPGVNLNIQCPTHLRHCSGMEERRFFLPTVLMPLLLHVQQGGRA